MLQACWDRDLRYFDTAPLYGESESRLGRFLQGRDRGKFMVSSKVGRFPARPGARRFSFGRADVEQSVYESLHHLRIAHIDMLSLHDLTPAMLGSDYEAARHDLRNGTLDLLMGLRRSGTVGLLGVAVYDPEAALSLLHEAPFDYILVVGAYTLLSQAAERALLPYCARMGIGVLAASPFHSGLLVTGDVPGARFNFEEPSLGTLRRVAAIQRLCARYDVALPAAALQFGLRHPAISSIITGHRSPAEVAGNLAWLDAPIPEAFWHDLAGEHLIEPATPDAC